jgi:hypothetical protein
MRFLEIREWPDMSRLIKDHVELGDHMSLDALIARLIDVRACLPPWAEAEIRMRGDDIFGRHLCIGFLRPLTVEEASVCGRYDPRGSRSVLRVAAP